MGYRATKSHFGNDYTMGISKGAEDEPPVFTVSVSEKHNCKQHCSINSSFET